MRRLRFAIPFRTLLALMPILAPGQTWAQAPVIEPANPPASPARNFLTRLSVGGGQAIQDGRQGDSEWGAEVLLSANEFQRYGIHVSTLTLNKTPVRQRYICTGYVLEMVLFHWLRAEIGTVGFIGRGEASGKNPSGILCTLGYEKRVGDLNYSIGYASKTIFTQPVITINNLDLSVGLHF